jgi:hypothetical protein
VAAPAERHRRPVGRARPLLAARGRRIDVYVHEGRVPVDRRAPDTPVEAGATRVSVLTTSSGATRAGRTI